MKYFHERLRAERKRLALSQVDFAALGGVKKDAQLNYESGTRKPDAGYLAALASAGVDVLFVLTGQYSVGALPADESQLLAGYRALDARGKSGVVGMIVGLSAPQQAAPKAVFHGDVSQVVQGDQHVSAPINFSIGGKKK